MQEAQRGEACQKTHDASVRFLSYMVQKLFLAKGEKKFNTEILGNPWISVKVGGATEDNASRPRPPNTPENSTGKLPLSLDPTSCTLLLLRSELHFTETVVSREDPFLHREPDLSGQWEGGRRNMTPQQSLSTGLTSSSHKVRQVAPAERSLSPTPIYQGQTRLGNQGSGLFSTHRMRVLCPSPRLIKGGRFFK